MNSEGSIPVCNTKPWLVHWGSDLALSFSLPSLADAVTFTCTTNRRWPLHQNQQPGGFHKPSFPQFGCNDQCWFATKGEETDSEYAKAQNLPICEQDHTYLAIGSNFAWISRPSRSKLLLKLATKLWLHSYSCQSPLESAITTFGEIQNCN